MKNLPLRRLLGKPRDKIQPEAWSVTVYVKHTVAADMKILASLYACITPADSEHASSSILHVRNTQGEDKQHNTDPDVSSLVYSLPLGKLFGYCTLKITSIPTFNTFSLSNLHMKVLLHIITSYITQNITGTGSPPSYCFCLQVYTFWMASIPLLFLLRSSLNSQ